MGESVTKPFTEEVVSYKHGDNIILHQWADTGDLLVNCQSPTPQSFICQVCIPREIALQLYVSHAGSSDQNLFNVLSDSILCHLFDMPRHESTEVLDMPCGEYVWQMVVVYMLITGCCCVPQPFCKLHLCSNPRPKPVPIQLLPVYSTAYPKAKWRGRWTSPARAISSGLE